MIVNETLPVIADSVLGGGVISVVVSTVLIVMYDTRGMTSRVHWHILTQFRGNYPSISLHPSWSLSWSQDGRLYKVFDLCFGKSIQIVQNISYKCMQCVIAWPVAKILELALGPHHGIIYRRAGRPHLHLLQLLTESFTDTFFFRTKGTHCHALISRYSWWRFEIRYRYYHWRYPWFARKGCETSAYTLWPWTHMADTWT